MLSTQLQQNKPLTSTDEKTDVVISDSIIYRPKINCTYHLKNGDHDTEITFEGDGVQHFQYFDVASGAARTDTDSDTTSYIFPGLYLLSDKSLSSDDKPISPLPIIYTSENSTFTIPKKICFEFKPANKKNDYMCAIKYANEGTKAYVAENQSILAMVKKCLPETKIEVGKFPLFLQKNRPSHDLLDSIYKNFVRYNDKEKLDYQYTKLSSSKCHIRAHFVNRLLEKEGIQSFKIYKYWDNPKIAWLGYDYKLWKFHCAAMILDQEGNAWVWDPWVGNNTKLLTINEWMHTADEPTPDSALITGSLNLILPNKKIEGYHPHFTTDAENKDIIIIQSLFISAEPKSSKYPLKSSLVVEDEIRMMEQMDISLGSTPIGILQTQKPIDALSSESKLVGPGKTNKRKADDSERLETNSSLTSFVGSMFKKIKLALEPDHSRESSKKIDSQYNRQR